MPSSVITLGDLRLAAQQAADQENSTFLSTTEWNANINRSIKSLYNLLIQKFGNNYFVATPSTITTDGVNYLFALPTDFYKLLGVDLVINGTPTRYVPMKKFNLAERGGAFYQGAIPQAGQVARVLYAPRFTDLVNDADTFDGIAGYEEYVILDAAIKAARKEETDTSDLKASKQEIRAEIESAAENRDAANPATVSDTAFRSRSFYAMGAPNALRYCLSGNNLWLENVAGGGGPFG